MDGALDRLVAFCGEHGSVACYGASDHGHVVKHFLEMRGCSVTAFVVSERNPEDTERDGVPLYSVDEVGRLPDGAGIVLSLYETHHDVVTRLLREHGWRGDVLAISDSAQMKARAALLVSERDGVLQSGSDIREQDATLHEQRLQQILSRYRFIECRFTMPLRLGSFVDWIFQLSIREKYHGDVFFLLYPYTQEHREEERLRGANGYLLSKLQDEGIEALSWKNLGFWQYAYSRCPEHFHFVDDFEAYGWTKDFKAHGKNFFLRQRMPRRVYVRFEETEMRDGEAQMARMGISRPFVCISNRDIAYVQHLKRDLMKPDFRDPYRNSSIESHALEIDYLQSRGIQAVRMGAAVEQGFDHPGLVDYASRHRSEFMDVYLASACKFFVCDTCGISTLPTMFSKPMLILNSPLLTVRYDAPMVLDPGKDIAILMKLWDRRCRRFLSIRDMLHYEIDICVRSRNMQMAVFTEYRARDIVPIANTPEEIRDAAREMDERIDGTVEYDDLDIELQARYREIVDNYPMGESILCNWRIGAAFLRENQWLLD